MAWEAGLSYNTELAHDTWSALENQTVEFLATALANDKYERTFPIWNERNQRTFDRWIKQYTSLPHDVLVKACMDVAERTNTADNGGFMIWIDKGGCSKVAPSHRRDRSN